MYMKKSHYLFLLFFFLLQSCSKGDSWENENIHIGVSSNETNYNEIISFTIENVNLANIVSIHWDFGDGKIFVYDVEDAVRIRTGEHGTDAL